MATILDTGMRAPRPPAPHAPDRYERLLAIASAALLGMVLAAVARGHGRWGEATGAVWLHLATVSLALALTPAMLLRPRGNGMHRRLGRIWAASLFGTAIVSFFVTTSRPGHFSVIHILSAWMLALVPAIVWSARTHRVALHRRAVRGAVTGALLIAGFFTFPFDRMLGHWLFG